MWKGFRCKGQLSGRVDMGTDPFTAESEAWNQLFMGDNGFDDWEEFMFDTEIEREEQGISIIIASASATTAKRRRPAHQTEEAKTAWDEELRLLKKNTRAREARLKKKQVFSTIFTIFPL